MSEDLNKTQTAPNASAKDSTPSDLSNPPGPSNPSDLFTIKVGGEERVMSLEDLKRAASESLGAQKAFQQAAEMRKQAESALQTAAKFEKTVELLGILRNGQDLSYAQATELAGIIGGDPEDYMAESAPSPAQGSSGKEESRQMDPETMQLINSLKEQVEALTRYKAEQDADVTFRNIKSNVENMLDNDPVLSKMIKESSNKEETRSALCDMVLNDVTVRIYGGRQLGADLLQEALQRTRAIVNKVGKPVIHDKDSILPIVGLSPSSLSTQEVLSDKPIDRVKSGEPGYADNFAARLVQRFMKTQGK